MKHGSLFLNATTPADEMRIYNFKQIRDMRDISREPIQDQRHLHSVRECFTEVSPRQITQVKMKQEEWCSRLGRSQPVFSLSVFGTQNDNIKLCPACNRLLIFKYQAGQATGNDEDELLRFMYLVLGHGQTMKPARDCGR